MRSKKRYVLLKTTPDSMPDDARLLFQTESGYVFRVSPVQAEKLRKSAVMISGAIRNIKNHTKSPKSKKA